MNQKELGRIGEEIASRYLEKKGYQILEKNYLVKLNSGFQKGEIDIIAKKAGILVFIEVKLLSIIGDNNIFNPENKVNFVKRKKIVKIAQFWMIDKKIPLDSRWRIDVVAIELNRSSNKAKVKHIENI